MKHILVFEAVVLLSSVAMMSQTTPSKCATTPSEIVASHISDEITLDARQPAPEWQKAEAIVFCSNWQGKSPDQQRETGVRILWSAQTLYLRFECRFRELFLFEDSDGNGRRDHLWDRDVAGAFLQPDPARKPSYRACEVSRNGMSIDLSIFPGGVADLKTGVKVALFPEEKPRCWAPEL